MFGLENLHIPNEQSLLKNSANNYRRESLHNLFTEPSCH
jgi:hypothetical protein